VGEPCYGDGDEQQQLRGVKFQHRNRKGHCSGVTEERAGQNALVPETTRQRGIHRNADRSGDLPDEEVPTRADRAQLIEGDDQHRRTPGHMSEYANPDRDFGVDEVRIAESIADDNPSTDVCRGCGPHRRSVSLLIERFCYSTRFDQVAPPLSCALLFVAQSAIGNPGLVSHAAIIRATLGITASP
jgi:hypothetical protein